MLPPLAPIAGVSPHRAEGRVRHGRAEQADRQATIEVSGTGPSVGTLAVTITNALDIAVVQAVTWLKKHPGRDHIDAAYAVAASTNRTGEGQEFCTRRWPELVEAVKLVTQNQNRVS